jgi:hypothetical protein
MTKYRPHRGLLADAMAEVVEVNSLAELVEHMRASVISWYPPDELPTIDNTKVEPYTFDDRIGWHTHLVTVKGSAWSFTDGPFTMTTLTQRGLIRAINRIVDVVNTIREEGMRRDRDLNGPADWYAIDRLAAIRDVAIAAIAGNDNACIDGSELRPEDLDDENFDLDIGSKMD